MKNSFFLLFSVFLLAACSTPQKSFEKQNYRQAFKLSLKKAKNKKATRSDRQILSESLRQILMENDNEISMFRNGETPKQWQKSFKVIEDSRSKIEKASPFLEFDFSDKNKSLSDVETRIQDDIYAFYVENGKLDLEHSIESGDKLAAQNAYQHFQNAKKYTDKIHFLDSLQAVCVEYGELIYSIRTDAPFGLDWEVDRVFGDLRNKSNLFLTVFYEQYPADVDCEIEIDFRDIDIDFDSDVTEDREFREQVESGYRTEKDTAGNEIRIPTYEEVSGYVKVEELSKVATADIQIRVYAKSDNCRLSNRSFREEIVNTIERTYISGDRRAIPSRYDDDFQDDLMDDDDLAEELIEELYNEVRNYIF